MQCSAKNYRMAALFQRRCETEKMKETCQMPSCRWDKQSNRYEEACVSRKIKTPQTTNTHTITTTVCPKDERDVHESLSILERSNSKPVFQDKHTSIIFYHSFCWYLPVFVRMCVYLMFAFPNALYHKYTKVINNFALQSIDMHQCILRTELLII